MVHSLESLTTATVSLALDAAARRQQAIAANVAHANTEGYAAVRVSFESQLAEARQSLRDRGSVQPADLAGVRAELHSTADAGGGPVRVQLDLEMAEMARNAVHYQALAQGLSRHLAMLAAAAGDGRK